MFDTKSVYALNKLDKDAIVYPSVTGEDIRLTREDFSSEEEFLYWKKKSDANYHKTENDGKMTAAACLWIPSVIRPLPLRRMLCLLLT